MTRQGVRVEVKGVSKEVDGIPLVQPVDLVAEPGQCVAVRGSNGSGKTTLLNLIAGRWTASAGTVTIDGLESDERLPAVRAQVAALIGSLALYRDMTLLDHLTLIDATWGRDPDTYDDRAGAALDELGLSALASRFPHELSSGQRQLFGLAVTLFRPSELLVLDEPEQRLDANWRIQVSTALQCRAKAGTTMVLACHDGQMIDVVADTVVDLDSS